MKKAILAILEETGVISRRPQPKFKPTLRVARTVYPDKQRDFNTWSTEIHADLKSISKKN